MQKFFVLVTGCDSGFGARLVEMLIEQSSNHVIACHHTARGRDRFPSNSRVSRLVVDITSDDSVEKLKNSVDSILKDEEGALLGLVNNAGGLLSSGPIEWASCVDHANQMNLNYMGTVRLTKAFLPHIRASRGRIVNVSSILGLVSSPFGGVYGASKFALEGWTDALRREMLPFGVRVCLVEPGMFRETRFYDKYTAPVHNGWTELTDETKKAYGSHYPKYVESRLTGLLRALGSANTDGPARAMLHALTARYPHRRYREGFDCTVLARIVQAVPQEIADLVMVAGDALITMRLDMWPQCPSGRSVVQLVLFSLFGYSFLGLVVLAGVVFSCFLVF